MWTKRPLTQACVDYAAADIVLIAKLYSAFVAKDYIDETALLIQSARYLSLHKNRLGKAGHGHPLLPLEVTSAPSPFVSCHICNTCSRSLSDACFSKAGIKQAKQRNCWVCRAVKVHDARQESIRRNWEEREYYDDDSV